MQVLFPPLGEEPIWVALGQLHGSPRAPQKEGKSQPPLNSLCLENPEKDRRKSELARRQMLVTITGSSDVLMEQTPECFSAPGCCRFFTLLHGWVSNKVASIQARQFWDLKKKKAELISLMSKKHFLQLTGKGCFYTACRPMSYPGIRRKLNAFSFPDGYYVKPKGKKRGGRERKEGRRASHSFLRILILFTLLKMHLVQNCPIMPDTLIDSQLGERNPFF